MKKILIFISLILIYCNVSADSTDYQAEKVATFAKNMIIKGMGEEHIDKDGMPILCYGQGPARVDGYNEKLTYKTKSYDSQITINKNRWNFDCASFVSYVLKKTLNLTPDVSKDIPTIIINNLNTEFTKSITLNIKIKDEDGIVEYKIYRENEESLPIKIEKNNDYEINYDIRENGIYYVYAKDSFDNEKREVINITNIDNTPPIIDSVTFSDDYITIMAHDDESGLSDNAYSFDNCMSFQMADKLKIENSGQYIICVTVIIINIIRDKRKENSYV